MKNEKKTVPVLIGGDLNAYSVARAFFEAERIKSRVFMRYKTGICSHVGFMKNTVNSELCRAEVLKRVLLDYAKAQVGERPLLVPCADWYTELLEALRGELSQDYYLFIPPYEVWRRLKDKAEFYSLLDERALPHPESLAFGRGDLGAMGCLSIPYPAVLKPSDSAEYWKYHFEGMRKVYFPKSREEAEEIAKQIFDAGYEGKLILQRYIGKREEELEVLTVYLDRTGEPCRAVLAEVLLEECGPTARGNHAALVTKPLDALSLSLIKMLKDIGYRGIANFDIIKDGERKYLLECNTRQGRSCDYLLAAGVNIAALMLADMRGERIEPCFEYPEIYWHSAPHESVVRHAFDKALLSRAERALMRGDGYTPFDDTAHCKSSPLRRAYLALHERRQRRVFDKYPQGDR
ncbi:MAG: hypothetical protein IJY65_04770 [Clostridia bacterium]|nr:hypothetical protein [Clostridia bacterium]